MRNEEKLDTEDYRAISIILLDLQLNNGKEPVC